MENDKEKIKKLVDECDALVICAGAGLSSAAGFEYDGKTILENFSNLFKKYSIRDMYSASFFDFEDVEERWNFWSKFIYLERYKDGAKPLYKKLFELVKDKNYFVITTNVDHQFQLSGFGEDRLFCTQGDYGLFQCPVPCHDKTYQNEIIIKTMIENIGNNLPLSSLVPKCPMCGREMVVKLRKDDSFVEDESWKLAMKRYKTFLQTNKKKKILFLELGVGMNTPSIIKFPFINMTREYKNAFYVCVNRENNIPFQLQNKSLFISDDISNVI